MMGGQSLAELTPDTQDALHSFRKGSAHKASAELEDMY